jgi:hypothetical protein
MKTKSIFPVSLCLLLSATAQAAEQSTPVIIDASPCLVLTRPIERLTCFEDQAQAAQQPGASIPQQDLPVVSIPRNTSASPAASQVQQPIQTRESAETTTGSVVNDINENFGIRGSDDGADRGREMIALVASVKELNPNRKFITLENGQIWEQKDTKPFILDAGDEIRIYPTRWGSSFRLASQSHSGFITVQRLQ